MVFTGKGKGRPNTYSIEVCEEVYNLYIGQQMTAQQVHELTGVPISSIHRLSTRYQLHLDQSPAQPKLPGLENY